MWEVGAKKEHFSLEAVLRNRELGAKNNKIAGSAPTTLQERNRPVLFQFYSNHNLAAF